MPKYKVVATLMWEINCDQDYKYCLDQARQQLEDLVDCHPDPDEYLHFNAQIDMSSMRERHKLKHIREVDQEDVFELVDNGEESITLHIEDQEYKIKLRSDRYLLFSENPNCVACGLKGTRMFLDMNTADQSMHFNLYGDQNGHLIMMTKDHIVPKSKGGHDNLDNYQTMCSVCNNLKANYDLNVEDICELRELAANKNKLPKKELNEIINTKRKELASPLTIVFREA